MTDNYPLITVIIPVYNTEKYLRQAISSVVNQTYKNVEIIVINDGSTDNSGHILDDIGRNYPEIIILHQKKNFGVSRARNKGLEFMSGDYVSFLDSDDYLEPDALSFLYELILDKEKVIAGCERNTIDFKMQDTDVNIQKKDPINLTVSKEEALLETGSRKLQLQSACHKLIPVILIEQNDKIRFNEKISHGEDGLFIFEIITRSNGMVYSDKPKWNVLARPDSASRSEYSEDMLTALEAVEIMIDKSNGNIELQESLEIYYTKRVIMLIKKLVNQRIVDNTELKKIRKYLIKYKRNYIKGSTSLPQKIAYYLTLYCSPRAIKIIYKIRSHDFFN